VRISARPRARLSPKCFCEPLELRSGEMAPAPFATLLTDARGSFDMMATVPVGCDDGLGDLHQTSQQQIRAKTQR